MDREKKSHVAFETWDLFFSNLESLRLLRCINQLRTFIKRHGNITL